MTNVLQVTDQDRFDLRIGRLDRILSELMGDARAAAQRRATGAGLPCGPALLMDEANQQTLKHHAEDIVAAGQAILRLLGKDVPATPQPGAAP